MRKQNLTVNLKKCIFAKPEVKFIGHIVGSGTIEMNPERIESLLNMKIPETKKQVKQILGLINYYRQFVNNFARIHTRRLVQNIGGREVRTIGDD